MKSFQGENKTEEIVLSRGFPNMPIKEEKHGKTIMSWRQFDILIFRQCFCEHSSAADTRLTV